jgi:hypothetical protein
VHNPTVPFPSTDVNFIIEENLYSPDVVSVTTSLVQFSYLESECRQLEFDFDKLYVVDDLSKAVKGHTPCIGDYGPGERSKPVVKPSFLESMRKSPIYEGFLIGTIVGQEKINHQYYRYTLELQNPNSIVNLFRKKRVEFEYIPVMGKGQGPDAQGKYEAVPLINHIGECRLVYMHEKDTILYNQRCESPRVIPLRYDFG